MNQSKNAVKDRALCSQAVKVHLILEMGICIFCPPKNAMLQYRDSNTRRQIGSKKELSLD